MAHLVEFLNNIAQFVEKLSHLDIEILENQDLFFTIIQSYLKKHDNLQIKALFENLELHGCSSFHQIVPHIGENEQHNQSAAYMPPFAWHPVGANDVSNEIHSGSADFQFQQFNATPGIMQLEMNSNLKHTTRSLPFNTNPESPDGLANDTAQFGNLLDRLSSFCHSPASCSLDSLSGPQTHHESYQTPSESENGNSGLALSEYGAVAISQTFHAPKCYSEHQTTHDNIPSLFQAIKVTSASLQDNPNWHELTFSKEIEIINILLKLIRNDAVEFMTNRWDSWKEGREIWQISKFQMPKLASSAASVTSDQRLLSAYRHVFELETRMKDDPIRMRFASLILHKEYSCTLEEARIAGNHQEDFVQGPGRGEATRVIDNIVRQSHGSDLIESEEAKKTRRNKFHNWNRQGKRWLLLSRHLGSGILLICSKETIAMVKKPTFSDHMINLMITVIVRFVPQVIAAIEPMNKLASQILNHQTLPSEAVIRELLQALDVKNRQLSAWTCEQKAFFKTATE